MNPISPINVFDLNICFDDERVYTQPGVGVENNPLDVDGLNSASCSYRSGLTFSFPDSPTCDFDPADGVPHVVNYNTHETNGLPQEQRRISRPPVEIQPFTNEPSSSSSFDETPVVDSGRKRNRPSLISGIAAASIKKHNYTEISYLIALYYLFSNTLPTQQPSDFIINTWNYLSDMANEGNLVLIHQRNPLVIKSIARLDFFYYTLGRYGTYQAHLRSDPQDETSDERDNWWIKSKICGPIATQKRSRSTDQKVWIYRTLYLPESMRQHLEAFDDKNMIMEIAQIFDRALTHTLQTEELMKAIHWGVEMREITILRPIEEALEIAIQEVVRGLCVINPGPPDIQLSVSNSVSETASVKRQRTNGRARAASSSKIDQVESTESGQVHGNSQWGRLLRKICALSILLDGKIGSQKPECVPQEKWEALNREKLVIPSTFYAFANVVTLRFKIPRDYDEYCKNRAIRGNEGIINFDKITTEKSLFRWWSFEGRQKPPFRLLEIKSKKVDAPEGSVFEWVERSVGIPSENVMCPRFAEMSLEDKLNAFKQIFEITFRKCYSYETYTEIERTGFGNFDHRQMPVKDVMTAFNAAVNEVLGAEV